MAQDNTHDGHKDNLELSIDDLDQAAGGYVFDSGGAFELIDDKTGDVLESDPYRSFMSYANSVNKVNASARQRGLSDKKINRDQLNRLRETGSI